MASESDYSSLPEDLAETLADLESSINALETDIETLTDEIALFKWLYEASDNTIWHEENLGGQKQTSYKLITHFYVDDVNQNIHSESTLRVRTETGGSASGGEYQIKVTDQDDNILSEHTKNYAVSNDTIDRDIDCSSVSEVKIYLKGDGSYTVALYDVWLRGDMIGQYSNISFPIYEEVS
mgnify:CR=1 FL=1